MKVSGEFEVTLSQVSSMARGTHGMKLGHISVKKRYRGALQAKSQGEMLSAVTPTPGSAGYVAIEQVRGTLNGKAGSFVLQHYGVMNRGVDQLILEVVPDSGSDDLEGLSGKMEISVENDKHFYEFEFELD